MGKENGPQTRVLVVFLDGPSCQLSPGCRKTPDVLKAPLALSGPGAAGMAVAACPPSSISSPNPRSAGPRARLWLRGGAVSFRPRVLSSLPGFLSVGRQPFSALLLEARTEPRCIQGTKPPLLKPSWGLVPPLGDRERERD